MAITTTGYTVKRYSDIIAEVRQELITASGNPNLEMSDDTILGIINNIYSLKLSELHELAQAQWSAGNPDTAEGIALDRIVARARITRLAEVKAYGDLHFTDTLGKTINNLTQVKDLAGNIVQTLQQLTLNASEVVGTVLNITAVNSATYNVSVDGVNYSFLADPTATVPEIINGLIVILSANGNLVLSNVSNRLSIQSTVPFSFAVGSDISVHNVTKAVASEAIIASTEDFEAGVLIYPVAALGSTTVTNRQKWVTGRLTETDAELRDRFKKSVGGQGSATVDAIYAKLLATAGIISASVEENWTAVTSASGIPSKAFECTVKGGSDLEVATTIWKAKPAGIQPFGNTSHVITDSQNNLQTIYFTRPIDQYIHVNVQYELYNEEVFPTNGEQMIANVIKAAGDALGVNEDVIPQRLMAAVYNNVNGISNLIITIGKTLNPLDTPILSSSPIAIGLKEESIFDLSRITVAPV